MANVKRGICFNTSTIRNCGLSVPEEIELASEIGYDGIELWVAEIEAYLNGGGTLAELRALLKAKSIEVPNLIAFFQWANPDDDARAKALDEAREVFNMARELECPYVAAPPSGVNTKSVPVVDLAEYYGDLQQATEEIGPKPLLEFWGGATTLGSLRSALNVLDALGDPDAVMLADVFHMSKVPGSELLLSELSGGRLGLFHVNDYPAAPDVTKLTDADRVYPGDGVAPIDEIVELLDEIGFSGMLSLELFNKGYEEKGAEAVARTGFNKTKRAFEG